MRKKVAVIQTFPYSLEDLKELFAKYLPEVEMINIIDDSLLAEALANKGVTNRARQRYLYYAKAAQAAGANIILNQCSSYSECVDWVQKDIDIPILKIDAPMAKQANQLGKKIAVIITAVSSLETSVKLVKSYGDEDTIVTPCFVKGAYEALLIEGNKEKHNALVITATEKAAQDHDVIALAQGSMFKLLPLMEHIDKPILASFESGVKQLREALELDK